MAERFRYLNVGLGVILGFVGIKMLLADVYHLPTWASLLVIMLILVVVVVASARVDRRDARRVEGATPGDVEADDPSRT